MRVFVSILGCLVLLLSCTAWAEEPAAGDAETFNQLARQTEDLQTGEFHGFVQYSFRIEGSNARIVVPKTAAAGKPWIWRARFWGHQPQLDLALLQAGWHVGYCDVADLFGNDVAVERWNHFYRLTQSTGLNSKPVLEGMSRGGLIVMRWATSQADNVSGSQADNVSGSQADNVSGSQADNVSGIYLDNAVMDIRSWPGGKGAGVGSESAWQKCLAAYGLTEEQSESFRDGPLDRLESLARARVPLFVMVNEADQVVPPAENSHLLIERYRKFGGPIDVLQRPGLGHHPHSLKDPAPLVDFAKRAIEPR